MILGRAIKALPMATRCRSPCERKSGLRFRKLTSSPRFSNSGSSLFKADPLPKLDLKQGGKAKEHFPVPLNAGAIQRTGKRIRHSRVENPVLPPHPILTIFFPQPQLFRWRLEGCHPSVATASFFRIHSHRTTQHTDLDSPTNDQHADVTRSRETRGGGNNEQRRKKSRIETQCRILMAKVMSVGGHMIYYEVEDRLSKTINNQRLLLSGHDLT